MGYSNTQKRGSPSLKEFSYTETDYQSKWINAFISCSYSETSLNQTLNKAESRINRILQCKKSLFILPVKTQAPVYSEHKNSSQSSV